MSGSPDSDSRKTPLKSPYNPTGQGSTPFGEPLASGNTAPSRTAPLVNNHISPYGFAKRVKGRVDLYAQRLDIIPEHTVQRRVDGRDWKRGVVGDFSYSSRRRMQTHLSKIHGDYYQTSLFLTLTYHNDWQGREPRKDLDTYLKRLRRRFPSMAYVWRLEAQKRLAPHYHLLLFFEDRLTDSQKSDITLQWHMIVDPESEYHSLYGAKLERDLDGMEGVRVYISKYCAKPSEMGEAQPEWWQGRYWASSRNLKTSMIATIPLHSEEEEQYLKGVVADYLVERASMEEASADSEQQRKAAHRKSRFANVVRSEHIKSRVMLKDAEKDFTDVIRQRLSEYRDKHRSWPVMTYEPHTQEETNQSFKPKHSRAFIYRTGRVLHPPVYRPRFSNTIKHSTP